MADDDNFDIDIYGDDSYQESSAQDTALPDASATNTDANSGENTAPSEAKAGDNNAASKQEATDTAANDGAQQDSTVQQISSTGGSGHDVHRQAPQQQGTKRKQGEDDDRPTDPGATAALMINDLNWWISEEDIRGWANQSGCEDELNEVTFNEHKVNGKSKGQVYVQLQSPQAATALKHQVDQLFKDQAHTKKPTAIFNPPHHNPFKTLPKDVPARDKNRNDQQPGGFNNRGGGNFNRFNNNRGNFNNRGGSMGYQNRNFSSPASGNMGGQMGGYGGQGGMQNFGGNPMMGGGNNFGGGFNRGGNMMGGAMRGGMNNRGGRGGMGMNNMGGGGMQMPMGGNMMMGGGMMGGGMNMSMMNGMGGAGFGGQPQFNPGFFPNQQQQQQGGNDHFNPHGAKRPRPE
ncbi:uncharacterized protein EKO05_0004036 [Ascochyta rabiei]|uniref:Nucleotide binding n=1 Tax=Didymella rabiei TaxID=5454 RepID=A0A162XV65_DIDRA|nr:uncharacterized protein EKO05_0004036 [Ascochyta rabiei]KZM19698.1 nucleotide binding [Ascochyta rabiei]UPX13530.1 hypothetical protein EKO05_0004036 [Ascochyta rabiei]